MDTRVYGGYSKAQSQWQLPSSPSGLGIKAQGTQDLLGQATAQRTPVTEVFSLHTVFSVIPVLQPFTHVLNFTPPKLPTAGFQKPRDALQNNTFGDQGFWFVIVHLFSTNVMVKLLLFY